MPRLMETKNGQFILTIPAKLAKAKDWGKGDSINVLINSRGNLELVRE